MREREREGLNSLNMERENIRRAAHKEAEKDVHIHCPQEVEKNKIAVLKQNKQTNSKMKSREEEQEAHKRYHKGKLQMDLFSPSPTSMILSLRKIIAGK